MKASVVGNSSHLCHSSLPNYDQERKECMRSPPALLLAVQDHVAISFKWSYFRYYRHLLTGLSCHGTEVCW